MGDGEGSFADSWRLAALVSLVTFTCGALFFHLLPQWQHLLYLDTLHLMVLVVICCVGAFFKFSGFKAIVVRSLFVSVIFSCRQFVPFPLDSFIQIISIFHLGEFVATAVSNPRSLKFSSFLLNHSPAYHAAMAAAVLEFSVEYYFFGAAKVNRQIYALGLAGAILGDVIRKVSMLWCGTGFTHLITYARSKEHKLVKTGPYAFCRHPSYFGWALWSISTQVCLCNPVCTVVFAFSSFKFFADRIPVEEFTLKQLFGAEYELYRLQVPFSGIPFVDGTLKPHHYE